MSRIVKHKWRFNLSVAILVFFVVLPASAAVSPNGTTILPGSGGTITDSSGNAWSFDGSGNVYLNGNAAAQGRQGQKLYYNNFVYVLGLSGNWWRWNNGWSMIAGSPPPANGRCGSANNTITNVAPTTNLCSAGDPSSVSGTGPWTWSCSGGGYTDSCIAYAPGTVLANPGSTGATIPTSFIGFSDEVPDVIADTIFTPSNTSLIGLLKLLGPNGVIAIGGGSCDTIPAPALTQQIANDTAAFVSALGPGWKTMYGLDALIQDSGIAVTQAGYLLNAFTSANIAFHVGDEPDGYSNIDQAGWTSIFNSYYYALTSAYLQVNFAGPDTISLSNISWRDGTVLGVNGFKFITGHKYTLPCNPATPTPDQLIADAALPPNPGVTVDGFGIICGGGVNGVTNVLMAATYYLRLAQSAFSGGYLGVYPHNVIIPQLWGDGLTRSAYYNQFVQEPDGGYGPAPMFYGMYLFAQLEGQISIGTTMDTSLNGLASVNATLGPHGNANILVVNINTTQQIIVTPQQTQPWSKANVYLLSGQNCEDPSPVLNGYPIGEGGTWAGSPGSLTNGASVSIPACGAALIEIQP
jgi:hypothetical protein